jgi:hypothetical protein
VPVCRITNAKINGRQTSSQAVANLNILGKSCPAVITDTQYRQSGSGILVDSWRADLGPPLIAPGKYGSFSTGLILNLHASFTSFLV